MHVHMGFWLISLALAASTLSLTLNILKRCSRLPNTRGGLVMEAALLLTAAGFAVWGIWLLSTYSSQ